MDQKLKELLIDVLKELGIEGDTFTVEHPGDLSHGDYATNVALIAAKKVGKNPRECAEAIVARLQEKHIQDIQDISVAGPGFINFSLTREFFAREVASILKERGDYGKGNTKLHEKVIIEYTDPNPFKVFHIGHLMPNVIGESLSRLIEWAGADIRRVCYQGDVGLHIAKALWGIKQLHEKMPADSDSLEQKVSFLGEAYAFGSQSYEESDAIKNEIQSINKKVYDKSDEELNNLYEWGRKLSLEKFDEIYAILGTSFDHFFFESETNIVGKQIVLEHIYDGIFEESDGAVIYKGEQDGYHTRVFINQIGLPTYEAKDLGLAKIKYDYYPYEESIIVTGSEQNDYFNVIISALKKIYPDLGNRTKHIGHGLLQLKEGKMSSRLGNVITGESLLYATIADAEDKLKERDIEESEKKEIAQKVAVAAIKYAILKQTIGKNIVYDKDKWLSFEGDSGPYLQYTYVRCKSVLEKAKDQGIKADASIMPSDITNLERLLYKFSEVAERSHKEFSPQLLTTYLIELAGEFNTYYANTKIIDSDKYSSYRLGLTESVAHIIKNGLWLLGIETVERM